MIRYFDGQPKHKTSETHPKTLQVNSQSSEDEVVPGNGSDDYILPKKDDDIEEFMGAAAGAEQVAGVMATREDDLPESANYWLYNW